MAEDNIIDLELARLALRFADVVDDQKDAEEIIKFCCGMFREQFTTILIDISERMAKQHTTSASLQSSEILFEVTKLLLNHRNSQSDDDFQFFDDVLAELENCDAEKKDAVRTLFREKIQRDFVRHTELNISVYDCTPSK